MALCSLGRKPVRERGDLAAGHNTFVSAPAVPGPSGIRRQAGRPGLPRRWDDRCLQAPGLLRAEGCLSWGGGAPAAGLRDALAFPTPLGSPWVRPRGGSGDGSGPRGPRESSGTPPPLGWHTEAGRPSPGGWGGKLSRLTMAVPIGRVKSPQVPGVGRRPAGACSPPPSPDAPGTGHTRRPPSWLRGRSAETAGPVSPGQSPPCGVPGPPWDSVPSRQTGRVASAGSTGPDCRGRLPQPDGEGPELGHFWTPRAGCGPATQRPHCSVAHTCSVRAEGSGFLKGTCPAEVGGRRRGVSACEEGTRSLPGAPLTVTVRGPFWKRGAVTLTSASARCRTGRAGWVGCAGQTLGVFIIRLVYPTNNETGRHCPQGPPAP